MSAVPTTPAQVAADAVALPRALARRLALPVVFLGATLYHFLQSRGHATPTIFNDELLYAKLSQSLAAGHGLSIRGEHFFFPAPLASVVLAPVWWLHSMTDAYAAAKLLNAAVMSAAVFPAYWLARRAVRPSFALLTAVATVATPAMVYHGYLMSEALAYPVFLTVAAVLVHAVERPSRVTPLVFIAFFAYVERGAPHRLAYTLVTCIGAVALSLVSLPALTGTAAFFFDSVTLSGFARASYELGLDNASLLYSLAPLALGAVALLARRTPHAVAILAIAASAAAGAGVYATDRLVTQFSARTFDTSPPDWLDRPALGPPSYLVLPYGNYLLRTNLESWNRDVKHVVVLATQPPDEYPHIHAGIAR